MPLKRCTVLLLSVLIPMLVLAQQPEADKFINLPDRFFNGINKKIQNLDRQLTRQTEKYLARLHKSEKKLQRKLSKIDSVKSANTFNNSKAEYEKLVAQLKNPPSLTGKLSGQYLPNIDSLSSVLNFLSKNQGILKSSEEIKDKLKGSLESLQLLQNKMKVADQAKVFINQRKDIIKQTVSRFTSLPAGLSKEFAAYKKEAFYYSRQIKEYKELLNQPEKLEKRVLSLLTKVPAFQQFMKEYSQLAGLFSLPGNYASNANVSGLQTISQVQGAIQGRLATGGPNAGQVLQQGLQTAQAQLNTLKDKLNQLGGGSDDMEMPDLPAGQAGFKPDDQRTKTFWKRLEYGTNLQSTKANNFYPSVTDLGLTVGYKIKNDAVVGIGAGYKIGFGKDIRHIVITSEGFNIKSFIDVKLKGSFFASGGFEYHYQQPFSELQQLGDYDVWRKVGLIGISKIISLRTKFFKKTKIQLLLDLLSFQQTPQARVLNFRVGYNF